MPLITPERLNSYLSGPDWSDVQWLEAADVCAEVEGELEARLNARISAGPARTESGALLDDGTLVLSAPVHTVTELDGTTITGGALPTGWQLLDGTLSSTETSLAYSVGYPTLSGGAGLVGAHHGFTVRAVPIVYLPGWGDVPALRSAILRKIQARWLNRHDDTVTARNLSAEAPQPLPEDWTDDDVKRLHVYRWPTVWR
jgi:hypothetical protein